MWSVDSDKCLLDMHGHELVVTALATNSGRKFKVIQSNKIASKIWNVVFQENTHLVSGSRDNYLYLWDLTSGKTISNIHISRNLVTVEFVFLKYCFLRHTTLNINSGNSAKSEIKITWLIRYLSTFWSPLLCSRIYFAVDAPKVGFFFFYKMIALNDFFLFLNPILP
jgi:WD40 repeat protein